MKGWDPRIYREHTGYISDLGMPVVELLDPRPGEAILDVGCGDGALTEKLVACGCTVVAIDDSADMVSAAAARGVDARCIDAATLELGGELDGRFDAVFSNAALHWMHPMDSVVRGIHRVLKPGGRFVAEFGGRGNIASIRRALHRALDERRIQPAGVDPWHFPSSKEYEELLMAAGFEVKSIEAFERPTVLPTGVADWLESVARPFLAAVPAADQKSFMAQVQVMLEPDLRSHDGVWRADYVRLRVVAIKKQA